MGERYLNKMHIEKPITYIEKFKQEELEDQPAAEQPAPIEPAKPELPEKNLLSEVRQAACHAGGQTRHTYRRKILGLHRISSMSFYKENRENREQLNRKAA